MLSFIIFLLVAFLFALFVYDRYVQRKLDSILQRKIFMNQEIKLTGFIRPQKIKIYIFHLVFLKVMMEVDFY